METITIRQRGLAPIVVGIALLGFAAVLWLKVAPLAGALLGALALLILLGRSALRIEGHAEAAVWWTLAGVALKKLRAVEPAAVQAVVITRVERRRPKGGVEQIHLVHLETRGGGRMDLWDEGAYPSSKRLGEEVARALHRPFRDEVANPPPGVAEASAAQAAARARSARVVGVVLIVASLAALSFAGFLAWRNLAFDRVAASAPGEVVELIPSRGSKGGTVWAPVVRWRVPEEDEDRLLRATTSSSPAAFDLGEQVVVRYLPASPEDARIDAFSERWLGAAVAGGIGALFLAIGAANLAFRRVR